MIRPTHCPRCGSENIWRTHLRDEGDNAYVKYVACKSCNHSWIEHYEILLTRIEIPKPEHIMGWCCGNCEHHTHGAGPADDGYIYCESDKSQHCKEHYCGDWRPEAGRI